MQKTTALKAKFAKTTTIHFFAKNTVSSVIFLQKALIGVFVSIERVYGRWGLFSAYVVQQFRFNAKTPLDFSTLLPGPPTTPQLASTHTGSAPPLLPSARGAAPPPDGGGLLGSSNMVVGRAGMGGVLCLELHVATAMALGPLPRPGREWCGGLLRRPGRGQIRPHRPAPSPPGTGPGGNTPGNSAC